MTEGGGSREEGEASGFAGLSLLLDGYFHEDFRREFEDHVAAARAFAVEASAEELIAARGAMVAFLGWAERVDREVWQEALGRVGGAWWPRSLAPLREVLAVIGAEGDAPRATNR